MLLFQKFKGDFAPPSQKSREIMLENSVDYALKHSPLAEQYGPGNITVQWDKTTNDGGQRTRGLTITFSNLKNLSINERRAMLQTVFDLVKNEVQNIFGDSATVRSTMTLDGVTPWKYFDRAGRLEIPITCVLPSQKEESKQVEQLPKKEPAQMSPHDKPRGDFFKSA